MATRALRASPLKSFMAFHGVSQRTTISLCSFFSFACF